MSIKSNFRIRCPFCKSVFDADVWTFVRGDIDYSLKEAIMTGEFNLFMCPSCGKVFSREETFVYLDPKAELMAFVFPSSYAKEKRKWEEKMKEDYESIKKTDAEDDILKFEPVLVFGLETLTEILLDERDREEECEVARYLIENEKLLSKDIPPSLAREKDILPVLPFEKELNVEAVLKCCRRLFKLNENLPRLKNLLDYAG